MDLVDRVALSMSSLQILSESLIYNPGLAHDIDTLLEMFIITNAWVSNLCTYKGIKSPKKGQYYQKCYWTASLSTHELEGFRNKSTYYLMSSLSLGIPMVIQSETQCNGRKC